MPLRQKISLALRAGRVLLCNALDTACCRMLLWRYGASVGRRLRVAGRIRCTNKGRLVIGDSVRINSGPDNNYVGGDRRTNLWVGRGGSLIIEDGAGISNSTIVARSSVVIRSQTLIGGGCDIYDNDFHELLSQDRQRATGNVEAAPVQIGPRAFVGGHTIILKGVTIGEGAVVGAGSLVTRSVPAYQLWAGRPARFIKELPRPDSEQV